MADAALFTVIGTLGGVALTVVSQQVTDTRRRRFEERASQRTERRENIDRWVADRKSAHAEFLNIGTQLFKLMRPTSSWSDGTESRAIELSEQAQASLATVDLLAADASRTAAQGWMDALAAQLYAWQVLDYRNEQRKAGDPDPDLGTLGDDVAEIMELNKASREAKAAYLEAARTELGTYATDPA
jgi:hypothetical protein